MKTLLASGRQPQRLLPVMAGLIELTGRDPAARRALSLGLARAARRGLTGATLLVAGFLALERWRRTQGA